MTPGDASTVRQAARHLADVLDLVDRGELVADDDGRAFLIGALAALSAEEPMLS